MVIGTAGPSRGLAYSSALLGAMWVYTAVARPPIAPPAVPPTPIPPLIPTAIQVLAHHPGVFFEIFSPVSKIPVLYVAVIYLVLDVALWHLPGARVIINPFKLLTIGW